MINLLKLFEKKQETKIDIPAYHPGDTLVVQVQVEEGANNRVRTQTFEGVVIKKRDRGIDSSFTLRKKTGGVGVERTFKVHSPLLKSVKVKRVGKVRRAKLFYLRGRTTKQARIAEKIVRKAKPSSKEVKS